MTQTHGPKKYLITSISKLMPYSCHTIQCYHQDSRSYLYNGTNSQHVQDMKHIETGAANSELSEKYFVIKSWPNKTDQNITKGSKRTTLIADNE